MNAQRIAGITAAGATVGYVRIARPQQLNWGATRRESNDPLSGDHLISQPHLTATRAITIHAPADTVWPWVAQMGQGRGGFYSYDFLENLVGCDIHSAEQIMPSWQDVDVGHEVKLAPAVGLAVACLERGRSLVLRGGVSIAHAAPPYDFTWAFALQDQSDETTRLLVRERFHYTRPWARLLVEPVEMASFVMSRKMLRGIKQRAERAAFHSQPTQQVGSRPR